MQIEQERGLMPNVIAAQPNIGVLKTDTTTIMIALKYIVINSYVMLHNMQGCVMWLTSSHWH